MRRYWYILVLIGLFCNLQANVVAKIGDKVIDSEELYAAMQKYSNTDMNLQEVQEKALEKLIEDKLLLIYAEENQINVEENEVEAFFMNEFGQHPIVCTNGKFDRSKYNKFKSSPDGRQFFQTIRNDILLSKTKKVLLNRFKLDDKTLLEQYILENSNIDLSYALLNINDLNLNVKISPQIAYDYFENNRNDFLTVPKINFKFLVVPFRNFHSQIKKDIGAQMQSLAASDSTLSKSYIDSLQTFLITQELKKQASQAAQFNQNRWQMGLSTQFPIWKSGYLAYNDSLSNLPNSLVHRAFQLGKNKISEPILVEDVGYIILKQDQLQSPQPADLSKCKQEVWQDFILDQNSYSVDKKDYYENNKEDFSITVAVVRVIEDVPPEARQLIANNYRDIAKLKKIIRHYDLDDDIKVIFLEQFKNELPSEDVIAKNILVERYDDFINLKDNSIFYTTLSIFPQYLPDFKEIENQIHIEQVETVDFTKKDLEEYYQENKNDFEAADSLQLGGVYYPVETDTIKIEQEISSKFYLENQKLFYRDDSVVFDYICTEKKPVRLVSYLNKGNDFELLKYCFSNCQSLPANKLTAYTALPDTIATTLRNMPNNSYSLPVYNDGKWFILNKKQEHTAGILNFPAARPLIENQLKFNIADSLAKAKARTIFDSTTYFGSCYSYAEQQHIFKSKFRNANDDFEILGDISEYRKELMQLWRNEKYASILNLKDGYAVIFLLKKKFGKQLDYEEALPQIKSIFNHEKKLEKATNYAEFLRQLISQGKNPNKIFYFLGGWHNIENLDLDSKLPGIKYSKTIIEDISKHESGYISPIIRISEDQLLLYKINSISKINKADFVRNKEQYKKQKLQKNYENWLKRYRNDHNILIYEEEN